MMPATNPTPIPDRYRRITPVLVVDGAARAIAFYTEVFGARERARFPGPAGTIVHAEVEIGDSVVILEDPSAFMGTEAPPSTGLKGSPVTLFIYVEDADAAIERAVERGATVRRPAQDQFYGDRDGHIVDPFGHGWTIATHVEDVAPEEMNRRMAELYGQASSGS